MTGWERARRALNIVNLSTPLGWAIAVLTRTRLHPAAAGLLYGVHYQPKLPIAGAFTVGNVVFWRSGPGAVAKAPRAAAHEARHSSQYASCLGLPFLPLYGAAALWSLWRAGDPASHNIFERWAGLADGGYPTRAQNRTAKNGTAQDRTAQDTIGRHASAQAAMHGSRV